VQVVTVASGADARNAWAKHRGSIVAILSDLNLPGESGISIVRALLDESIDVRVVFMTGDVYRDAEVSNAMQRVVKLLLKPFKPADLLDVLAGCLQR
jgi:CheY-like chemotaxis protein